MGLFARVIRDERGATAVEYGLIIAVIVIAMIAALAQVATSTIGMWESVEENVTSVS